MIEVYDNFLPQQYFNYLRDLLTSSTFPWNFFPNITSLGDCLDDTNSYGFSYTIFNSIQKYGIQETKESWITLPALFSIQEKVKCKTIVRARYDLTTYNPSNYRHPYHIDMNYHEFVSAILYMNETDGNTLIYDKKVVNADDIDHTKEYDIKESIDPVPNRLLVFDGHYVHTGHSPSKHKSRILLNSVYIN